MAHLNLRLPDQEKASIERAAVAEKMTVTGYVRHRLLTDITGDALARRITEMVEERQAEQHEKLLDAMEARITEIVTTVDSHREDFSTFRTNLAEALKQIIATVKEMK